LRILAIIVFMVMKEKLVILLMFSALLVKAQTYSLSFGYYDPVISDTAQMDGILGVSANIVNTGENIIDWPLHLWYMANDFIGFVEGSLVPDFVDFRLLPGDSVHIGWPTIDTATSTVTGGFIGVHQNTGFIEGDNIIVVWPAVSDSYIDDGVVIVVEQYIQNVYVLSSTADVSTHQAKPDFKLFLSSDSKLKVESLVKEIVHLEMYDVLGKKIVEQENKLVVNTQHIPEGVYVLVVGFEDGVQQSTKVYIR